MKWEVIVLFVVVVSLKSKKFSRSDPSKISLEHNMEMIELSELVNQEKGSRKKEMRNYFFT